MKILPYYLGWSDRKLNIIHSKLRNMCRSLSLGLQLVNLKLNPAVYILNVLVR